MSEIKHTCKILDYCLLSKDHKILFCIFCHNVVGYEKNGKRVLLNNVDHRIRHQYSEETLNDSV
jgi:hypothetical protein